MHDENILMVTKTMFETSNNKKMRRKSNHYFTQSDIFVEPHIKMEGKSHENF